MTSDVELVRDLAPLIPIGIAWARSRVTASRRHRDVGTKLDRVLRRQKVIFERLDRLESHARRWSHLP